MEEFTQNNNEVIHELEQTQREAERLGWNDRIKKRIAENPIATETEYQLGIYKEGLEYQVRDAVFLLNEKGYKTFQSGFHETKLRNQFVDMYNKNFTIPESMINYFKDKGFNVSVESFEDRSTLSVAPTTQDTVTLEDWKTFWDDFAEKIPPAEPEDLSHIKDYSLAIDFRKYQDSLKNKA
ncbi:MAG: hypothetical protein KBB86_00255 [Candidatus Pacebacteria bacterium]|nr:hypothetical protein [Candidatus Paceibacterota bacterium]